LCHRFHGCRQICLRIEHQTHFNPGTEFRVAMTSLGGGNDFSVMQLIYIYNIYRSSRRFYFRHPKICRGLDKLDSLPPSLIGTGHLTPIPKHPPSAPSPSRSCNSSLEGDSRRISFAEPVRPLRDVLTSRLRPPR
jgi:hypothetical protein